MSGRNPTVRRVATLALTGLLMGSVAACGGDATPAAKQEPGSQLEIWIRKPPGSGTEKTAKELAAKFTERSGVPTHVTALFDDFETKLQQAAAQKQLPDIVINDSAQLGTMRQAGHRARGRPRRHRRPGQAHPRVPGTPRKGADGKYYGVPNRASPSPCSSARTGARRSACRCRRPGTSSTPWRRRVHHQGPRRQRQGRHLRLRRPRHRPSAATCRWYFASFLWPAAATTSPGGQAVQAAPSTGDKSVARGQVAQGPVLHGEDRGSRAR